MMTVKMMKLIILLSFFTIIGKLHATQYIQRGDLHCEVTVCNENETDTFVVSCQKNGTRDTCSPCPPGTELKDVMHSLPENIHCRPKKACSKWEGTKDVDYQVSCPSIPKYSIPCECDVSKYYCNLDPCNCRQKRCPSGQILQKNCGCNYPETLERTSLPPTIRNRTTSAPTTSKDTTTTTSVTSSVSTPQESPPQIITKTTLSPEDKPKHSLHSDILLIAFASILFTATVICCIWLKCRRERTVQENNNTGGNHVVDDMTKNVGNQTEIQIEENDLITNVGDQIEKEDDIITNVGNQTEEEKNVLMKIAKIKERPVTNIFINATNIQFGDKSCIENQQLLLNNES